MPVRADISTEDWVQIRYNGRTYYVSVKSLIDAWIREKDLTE